MDYEELNKVLASSTDEIIKFLENDLEDLISDSEDYDAYETDETLNRIFHNTCCTYIFEESEKDSPLEIALHFLKMGQENPNKSFTRVYILGLHFFFRDSDLEKLIKELCKQYPTIPELVRFNKKYIKQDKIKKKEIK